ncbi:MAG: (Fe-S)-binding protein, partial [Candidatus Melainabacteria bacterium]|nr:(Fe-S)-binding protein [Candidatus Melainabacteria bacterium]
GLEEAEHCCGSAGIFNLTHTELSSKILKRKVEFLKETGTSVVVTTNPGCMLQLGFGVREAKLDIRICHLGELLDEAYGSQL